MTKRPPPEPVPRFARMVFISQLHTPPTPAYPACPYAHLQATEASQTRQTCGQRAALHACMSAARPGGQDQGPGLHSTAWFGRLRLRASTPARQPCQPAMPPTNPRRLGRPSPLARLPCYMYPLFPPRNQEPTASGLTTVILSCRAVTRESMQRHSGPPSGRW